MKIKQKILLHSCCAPCSTAVIERLKDEFEMVIFYYNPNIYPEEEYLKRKTEEIRYIERSAKKIREIKIFFDDDTYETFVPQK